MDFYLKKNSFIVYQKLPDKFVLKVSTDNIFTLNIHINNKFKKCLTMSKNLSDDSIINTVLNDDYIKSVSFNKVKNIIYKKFKMINIIL